MCNMDQKHVQNDEGYQLHKLPSDLNTYLWRYSHLVKLPVFEKVLRNKKSPLFTKRIENKDLIIGSWWPKDTKNVWKEHQGLSNFILNDLRYIWELKKDILYKLQRKINPSSKKCFFSLSLYKNPRGGNYLGG